MSQHYFETTHARRPVRVVMGYDRPRNYVFMTVERLDHDRYVYLYSNRFDEEAGVHCQDVYHYRDVLADLHIIVPTSMFEEVERDRISRTGTRVVHHFSSGEWSDCT